MELTKNAGGFIRRTVIDNNTFNRHAGFTEDFIHQTTNSFSAAVCRNNDADVD